ncbi:MAG: hypothetical protein PF439_02405 [Helicobacteraceae bacterium]|jgi:hypothetical protein|nr:hypothetical protein [Helicobacteraceae bacterium]
MEKDEILQIGIDENKRLFIIPKTKSFPYIYRETMEVHWNSEGKFLYSPKPREWSYIEWYTQILKAVKEQSCILTITENTQLVNIPEELKNEIINYQASA